MPLHISLTRVAQSFLSFSPSFHFLTHSFILAVKIDLTSACVCSGRLHLYNSAFFTT